MFAAVVSAMTLYGLDLKGRILTPDNEPVDYAIVSAFALPDSTFIAMTNSDANGNFILTVPDAKAAAAFLRVEAMGHTPLTVSDLNNISSLVMTPVSKNLEGVTVSARRSPVKAEAGRFFYDPSELRDETNDAIGVLERMPLVTFSDNSAKIFGRGEATIYINGRPPRMPRPALMEYLRTVRPANIKKVEVIVNPGASFGSGVNGIINLIIDNPYEGFLSSTGISARYDDERVSPQISTWLGYSKGKFNMSVAPYLIMSNSYRRNRVINEFFESGVTRNVITEQRNKNLTAGGSLDMDYNFSSKFWLGANLALAGMHNKTTGATDGSQTDAAGIESRTEGTMRSETPFSGPIVSTGIYSEWRPAAHSVIKLSGGYYTSIDKYEATNEFNGVESHERSRADNTVAAASLKYSYETEALGTINAGYAVDRSVNDMSDLTGANSIAEIMNALYAEYSKSIGPVSVDAGLRCEGLNRHSMWGDAGSYRYNRWEWYPSASVDWNPGKLDQSISLSYRRTSSRTPFHYFNPVKQFTSEYAYTCGNPYLKPSSYHWLMLYYNIFGSLTFSSYYNWGNDGVTQFVRDDGNYTVTSYTNTASDKSLHLSMQYTRKVLPFLRVKVASGVSKDKYTAYIFDDMVRTAGWSWDYDAYLFFIFPKRYGLSANVTYSGYSPKEYLDGNTRWVHNLSASIEKTFANLGQIRLYVGDILGRGYFSNRHYRDETSAYSTRRMGGLHPDVTLSVRFYFGKTTINRTRYMSSDEIDRKTAR